MPHKSWVITGGMGFLGLPLINILTAYGIPVIVITRREANESLLITKSIERGYHPRSGLVSYIQGDVSQPYWGLQNSQWQACLDAAVVVHLAAELHVGHSLTTQMDVNAQAVLPLIQLAAAGVRVIHLSTLSVFASSTWPKDIPCPEAFPFDDSLRFIGGYAQSKILAEYLLYKHYLGGDITILRPSLLVESTTAPYNCPARDFLTLFTDTMQSLRVVPPAIPLEQANLIAAEHVGEIIFALGRVQGRSFDICHAANPEHTTLDHILAPLRCRMVSQQEFDQRLGTLSPLAQVLVRNAFQKPQPEKYWNYDIFHSTGRSYAHATLDAYHEGVPSKWSRRT